LPESFRVSRGIAAGQAVTGKGKSGHSTPIFDQMFDNCLLYLNREIGLSYCKKNHGYQNQDFYGRVIFVLMTFEHRLETRINRVFLNFI
jgi:hypothetical protein